MRYLPCGIGLAAVLFVVGCDRMPWLRPQPEPGLRVASATPTKEQIIACLNDNAKLVQTLECQDLDLGLRHGIQAISLPAHMVVQKPRNFRLVATFTGSTAADLGSNNQEFWFWSSKIDPPYLYHCSYQDLAGGQIRMPFPFQPEWVVEVLGMGEYDPAKPYQIYTQGNAIELVEQVRGPDGKPVQKVTILRRTPQNQLQVTRHVLLDANGKQICTANILQLQQDPTTGAILPKKIQLVSPADRLTMTMRLDGVVINRPLQPDQTARLFNRPLLRDVQGYDLARGPDGAYGQVRRAGGTSSLYR